MTINAKELRIGGLLVAFGLAFGTHAYFKIAIGTPARMGPGFFPILLSIVLAGLGALIGLRAFGTQPSPRASSSVRALLLILLAPIVFGLTVRGLGFAAAVAATVLISALASRTASLGQATALAAALTILCIAIFYYGVGVPVELIGPWLRP